MATSDPWKDILIFRNGRGDNPRHYHMGLKVLADPIKKIDTHILPHYRHSRWRRPEPSADVYLLDRLAEVEEETEQKHQKVTTAFARLFPDEALKASGEDAAESFATQVLDDIDVKRSLVGRFYEEHPTLFYATEFHLNTRGERMDFNAQWLRELYAIDLRGKYRRMALQKSVQCGVSEWAIVTLFTYADIGISTLYVLPNRDFRARFVTNRISRALEMVPQYRQMLADSKAEGRRTFNLMQIGNATQYFAAAGSENEFKEFPCDAVIVDEFDQCKTSNIAMAEDRFSRSPWKIKIDISNPSHPDYGICHLYKKASTQGVWMVQCEHCNYWQELDWWKHVIREEGDGTCLVLEKGYRPLETRKDPAVFCQRCWRAFNRLGKGAWVHKYPDRDTIGLQISKLFQGPPMTTLRELLIKYLLIRNDQTKLAKFYNSDLGLGFAQKGQKLDTEILNACLGSHRFGFNPSMDASGFRVMGIDVGAFFNYVIEDHPPVLVGGESRILEAREVKDIEMLHEAILEYQPDMIAMDWRPETRLAREFQEEHGNLVLVDYVVNGSDLYEDAKSDLYKIDRTAVMDEIVARFLEKQYILPGDAEGFMEGEFYNQLKAPVRIFNESRDTVRGDYQWVHNTPDHFFHSLVYAHIARRILIEKRGGSIGIFASGGLWTPKAPTLDPLTGKLVGEVQLGKSKSGRSARAILRKNPRAALQRILKEFEVERRQALGI